MTCTTRFHVILSLSLVALAAASPSGAKSSPPGPMGPPPGATPADSARMRARPPAARADRAPAQRMSLASGPSRSVQAATPAAVLPVSPGGTPADPSRMFAPSYVKPPAPPADPQITEDAPASRASVATRVAVPDVPKPTNATGRCKDGTYLTGAVSDAMCSDRGGLAVKFPARAQAGPVRQ